MRRKPVPGLCDRCGLRYPLKDLKFEYVLGVRTGRRTCPECYDVSHPQLDTRNVRTDDKQWVKDPRPDSPELAEVRRLFGFNPVGGSNASTWSSMRSGKVSVSIT